MENIGVKIAEKVLFVGCVIVVLVGYYSPSLFSVDSCGYVCGYFNKYSDGGFGFFVAFNAMVGVMFLVSCVRMRYGFSRKKAMGDKRLFIFDAHVGFPFFGIAKFTYDFKYEFGSYIGLLLMFASLFPYMYDRVSDSNVLSVIRWQGVVVVMSMAVWESLFGLVLVMISKDEDKK